MRLHAQRFRQVGYTSDDDENARYVLGEPKEHNVLVFGVNPSTAKPGNDDPTIRRIRKIIENRKNGHGWIMMNLYPQRTSYPEMLENNDTLRENNLKVLPWVLKFFSIDVIWCAWGTAIERPSKPFLYKSLGDIYDIVRVCGGGNIPWECYGRLTKEGHPRHPLYTALTEVFYPFDVQTYTARHILY